MQNESKCPMPLRDPPSAPMTLGNMRALGVRAVLATCRACRRSAEVVVDQLDDTECAAMRFICSSAPSTARKSILHRRFHWIISRCLKSTKCWPGSPPRLRK